jgi:hypothetical protein
MTNDWGIMIRKLVGVLVAATALLTVSAGAASAAPVRDAGLQQQVDSVLAAIPGGTRVSATEIRYDGLTVTVGSQGTAAASGDFSTLNISCAYGHLCFLVSGTKFDFYTCKTWDLTNWVGTVPFVNNQTTGTIARAYDNNWTERWRHTAGGSGERVTSW